MTNWFDIWPLHPLRGYKQLTESLLLMESLLHTTAASVKIVGTLNCLLTLPMLVKNIWWVNCDKQHWKDRETSQKWKKKFFAGSVPTISVWDWSYDEHTEFSTLALCSQEHYCHIKTIFYMTLFTNCWSNEVALRKAKIIFHSAQTQNIYFYLKNGLLSCRIKVMLCALWLLNNYSFHL